MVKPIQGRINVATLAVEMPTRREFTWVSLSLELWLNMSAWFVSDCFFLSRFLSLSIYIYLPYKRTNSLYCICFHSLKSTLCCSFVSYLSYSCKHDDVMCQLMLMLMCLYRAFLTWSYVIAVLLWPWSLLRVSLRSPISTLRSASLALYLTHTHSLILLPSLRSICIYLKYDLLLKHQGYYDESSPDNPNNPVSHLQVDTTSLVSRGALLLDRSTNEPLSLYIYICIYISLYRYLSLCLS